MNFIQNIFQNNNNRNRTGPSRPRPTSSTPNNAPAAADSSSNGMNQNSTRNNRDTATNANTGNPNPQNRHSSRPAGRATAVPLPPQHHPPLNPLEVIAQHIQAAAQSAFFHPHEHAHGQQQQQQQYGRPAGHHNPPPPTRAAPPASNKAIRQLPTVSVTPEDLVDENNRECCICFEEHHLHDKVMRLPCAHIYHPRCITEWLNRHCTCPVCRYELPTDNVVYERERKQRMKFRKPRYARYELERMQMKELKELCARLNVMTLGMMEKREFVDALVASEKIILISAPEPVEYPSVAVLRSMGVGQLKKAMKDAGVFFDSKDVVEKEDMVQIFVNSGRIVLLEKEEEEVPNHNHIHNNSRSGNGCVDPYGNACPDYYNHDNHDHRHQDNDYGEETKRARLEDEHDHGHEHEQVGETAVGVEMDMDPSSSDVDPTNNNDVSHGWTQEERQEEQTQEIMTQGSETVHTPSAENTEHPLPIETTSDHDHDHDMASVPDCNNASGGMAELPSFASRSIGEIRQLAASLNVDISGCIEKREMVDLIMEAIVNSARRRSS